MKRVIIETKFFSLALDNLVKIGKLLENDYVQFQKNLLQNPNLGDVIQGTGGLRKSRLKSSSKGKRGSFRICYLDIPNREELYLIYLFPKNVKENLSLKEKQVLKDLVVKLKKGGI